jgi:molecular chaperone GrpE
LKRVDPARGSKFDPNLHQAMMEQPADDAPPGSVLQVIQDGYELMGRLVRPAMVVVAAKGAGVKAAGAAAYAAAADPGDGGAVDTKA